MKRIILLLSAYAVVCRDMYVESLVLRLGTGLCVAGVIWHFSTNYSISGITLYIDYSIVICSQSTLKIV